MFNTDKIVNLVTELEATLEVSSKINETKKSQIESLFYTLNNEIIETYKTTNNQSSSVSFKDTIIDIINDVIATTEKQSIHNIMLVSEKILLNRNIKHLLINYTNARLIDKYSQFITSKDLKLSLSNDKEEYNKNLKSVIKKARLQYDQQIINTNKDLYNHLKTKSINFLEVMAILVKIVIKEKKANKED